MRLTLRKVFFLLVYVTIVFFALSAFLIYQWNISTYVHKNFTATFTNGKFLDTPIIVTFVPKNLEVYDVNLLKLYPQYNDKSDRIIEQLDYKSNIQTEKEILVYLPNNFTVWNVDVREDVFGHCNSRNCKLTENKNDSSIADAVVFSHSLINQPTRPRGQIWILYLLENPYNTPRYYRNYQFNYTATYRFDSDIVTPYGKFRNTNRKNESISENQVQVNYAAGKSKLVAWFVSHCKSKNRREKYVNELNKYIRVDVYGSCGKLKCPRHDIKCFQILNKDYKFYLSFENGNCQDYITEKFFTNGIQNNIIPVVMGARRLDYLRVAPEHSFIHVDEFDSAKSLANYLHYLDKNDTAYNEYFAWKHKGRYEVVDTKFWCRLCTMLNNPIPKVYVNFNHWWRGPGVCRGSSKIFSTALLLLYYCICVFIKL